MRMTSAEGTFGRPGMVMISPQITTTKPAPAESRTSRTGTRVPGRRAAPVRVGGEAVLGLGHADRQVAVALLLPLLELVADRLVGEHLVGAVDALGDGLDLLEERHLGRVERRELRASRSRRPRPPCARDPRCPVDPLAQWRQTIASAPWPRTYSCIAAISASVSETKWLIATTAGTPNCFTFSMCRPRLAQPFFTASTFSVAEVVLGDAAVHLQRADGGDDHRRRRASGRPCGT